MENENNENLNSSNETADGQQKEIENQPQELDVDALKQQNRQLFERAKKAEVEAKELRAKLPKDEPKQKEPKKSDELDYAQKAYLKASGINSDEFDFVNQIMQETGKDLDGILTSKYFQAELKERRDMKIVDNAVPQTTTGRNNQVPANRTVEYWLSKGDFDLPDDRPENRKLIQDVINARYEAKRLGQ